MEEKKLEQQVTPYLSSTELYLNPDIVQDFTCSICLNVLSNPLIDSCQHMFCKDCIEKVQAIKNICPLSNQPITQLYPIPKALQNFLSEQKLKCKHYQKGCKWIGKSCELEKHLERQCEFEDLNCKVCKKQVGNRKKLELHLKEEAMEHYYLLENLLEKQNQQDQMESQLKMVEKLLIQNQVMITLHEHPLKLYTREQRSSRWFCDSVTDSPNKICLMDHEEQYQERSYPKFICAQSCNKYYCPLCVIKYLKK